ncbi:MAG: glutaredoxin family protein [Planctomycetaceae bacterium]
MFTTGLLGLTLTLLKFFGLPIPAFVKDFVWVTVSLIATLWGAAWMWSGDHPRTEWRPSRPGRRFNTAVLYTRRECGLCHEAHELLGHYAAFLPELIVVDVDEEPEAFQKFDTCVPVLELDGKVRFRGKISETLLKRMLEATTPQVD